MILFSVAINCAVHVIMYSYYFMAVFGSVVQKRLESFKKCITVIQMVIQHKTILYTNICFCILRIFFFTILQIQFTLILIQCTLALINNCDVPKVLMAIYVPNVLFIFYMFYNFFKSAYGKRQTNKKLK